MRGSGRTGEHERADERQDEDDQTPAHGRWHSTKVGDEARVELPTYVYGDIEVYVNGVPQVEGRDYRREEDALVFDRPLAKEGRLGIVRWLSMFLGVAGTYRQNDSVDVVYEQAGRRMVATNLPIVRR